MQSPYIYIKPAKAGILLNKLSDHQPCFIILDITCSGCNNPKFIRTYVQLEHIIENINNDICSSELDDKIDKSLTTDPNISYNILHDVIEKTKNTHMTSKLVKYNKYKHKKSKWITRGLLRSIRFRDNLYDTIDHAIMLTKLEHYGVDGIPLQLLKTYLTNRKQYVKLHEVNSNVLPINTGVPQGSILGPLLFIIYINNFARASAIFDFICYADDTTLFSTLNKFINAQNINPDIIINTELAKINEWLEINKLSLNVTKSKFMVFHTQHKHRAIKPPVPKINNTNIEQVEQFKFLGLTLDSNLNWKKHSDNITNKCSQIIGILNRLKHILPQSIKIMLYNSLLLPHINYCLVNWGYQCKRINILQKRAVRRRSSRN